MAIQIQGGTSGAVADVDTTFKSQRISPRPLEYGTGGSYRNAMRSGTLAVALAANANIYSFRNASASLIAIIHRVRAQVFANAAFTAAFNDMSIKMHVARSYTVTHATGGVAATLTGNNAKLRTTMPTCTSLIHIANTGALSGGTATLDTDPLVYSQVGKPNVMNAAAATEYLAAQPLVMLDYEPDLGDGAHPLVLAPNEGFILQNGLVWPAAGTGILVVQTAWSEVQAF